MRVINLGGCWALFSVCVAIMIEHHLLFSMLGIYVFDRFLEAFDCAAQVRTHVLELLGAEHHDHDQQDDQPMPDRKRTHDASPSASFGAVA